ncbi:MAG: crossover junction endodeoxyribonuclease RuvC [Candidatus Fraserbacteria bacterium RBG_16_55_9]|uniref:Crossover junction endodeoxyribonuclease RuvC n=1 Tax=Fraserbacteria sp. (strain RBG_16_55_9) TaxID=1817864 RepID=A0A1F5UWF7_FRAXR|nr:MAG: crossover junction endodeoxyribonuclease RuvC [Candidatus Fraserbacteria bacterium RBG_16_55_9]
MKVLGIDPGLATTGYAVIQEGGSSSLNRMKVLEAGVIRTPPGDPIPQRLKSIYDEVVRLIEEYQPQALAVEQLFFNQNVTTAMVVSQARGVVLLAAHCLQVESYTPLEVKRQISGYGRAKKPQIQAMVQRLLGLRELPKPDDAADALAVALCHLLRYRSKLSPLRKRR